MAVPWGQGALRRREAAAEAEVLRDALERRVRELSTDRALLSSVTTVARLPVVVSARALIADNGAALPMVAVRDGVAVTPTPSLVLRPDPRMSRRRWVHRALMSLTGWGNLYCGVLRLGADAWPLSTTVLHPDYLSPQYGADGRTITGWLYDGLELDLNAVAHVPLWELDLAPTARAPLAECGAAFDDLALLWGFATAYWREGGLPPYVLKTPARLKRSQANAALLQWLEARMQHRPGLLTGSWSLENLGQPSARDALLLEGLEYIDATVARVFGMPPSLLNTRDLSGSLTYANAQDELRRWLNLSLYPMWLARVEDVLTSMLPRGQQAMFATVGLGALGLAPAVADEGRPAGGALSAPPPAPTPATNGGAP